MAFAPCVPCEAQVWVYSPRIIPLASQAFPLSPNLPFHYKKHRKVMASRTEVSPGRRKNTMSEQISALGAMLTRVLSSGEPAGASTTPATTTRERERHSASSEGGDDDGRSQGEYCKVERREPCASLVPARLISELPASLISGPSLAQLPC